MENNQELNVMWNFKGDGGCEVKSVLQYYQTKVCLNVHFNVRIKFFYHI